MIRVVLAEDQAMVRGALSALLNLEPDIEVVGEAADGEIAWRELQRCMPDVLVTDIEMPGLTGLELAQRIQRHDELACKVVIVTTFARAGFLRRALDAGVAGYLLKDAPADRSSPGTGPTAPLPSRHRSPIFASQDPTAVHVAAVSALKIDGRA